MDSFDLNIHATTKSQLQWIPLSYQSLGLQPMNLSIHVRTYCPTVFTERCGFCKRTKMPGFARTEIRLKCVVSEDEATFLDIREGVETENSMRLH